MTTPWHVLVSAEDFDATTEIARLRQPGVGGICTFVGTVRESNLDDTVSLLYLEHYPGMTERQIETIIGEARERWPLEAATVIHRVGQLAPGDQIVFVGAASAHRGAAFDACEYIIDYLKTRATFWKKETAGGEDRWLTTRQSDVDTAAAWQDTGKEP